ncbi:MAG: YitT family protein [Flavipsychrobacter sp.]|nr:YitT family protein [Flavipsychrobacter sp.]
MKSYELRQGAKDIAYTVAGILSCTFALNALLVPNHFLDGGVTGMSLLLYEILHHEGTHFPLAIIILLASIPFIFMGAYQVSRGFAIKTFAAVAGLALALTFISFETISHDKLICSVFGGFFMGTGIGLCMRGGCALDGIEILALYTGKRSSFRISEIILGLNIIIFLAAAFYLGLETAFYSILTYFVASKMIDFVVEGLEEYTGVTIISGKSEEIKEKLVMQLGRGITVYKGERGFLKESFDVSQDCDIIFTVITRLEVRRLRNMVHDTDPKAFVFTSTIKEAAGGVLKRRAKH